MGRQIIGQKFTGKYLSRNPFKKLLIKHFFNTIYKMTRDLEFSTGLEIGCGAGFSTQYLETMFLYMEASDLNYDLVKEAQKRNPAIRIIQESIYNTVRARNSFDMVVVLEVLEHLKHPWTAIKEVKRVTKKYALFSVPHEPLWSLIHAYRDDPGHILHFRREHFEYLVNEHFTIISQVTSFPWQIILAEK